MTMRARQGTLIASSAVIALLLTASARAQSSAPVAGEYCLTGIREVGSCFQFTADQTFEYGLSYGAYDENAAGRWRLDGDEVILDTPPYDRKPSFTFRESRSGSGDRFSIVVVTSSGRGIAGVDVRARCEGRVIEGYTQQDGYLTPCTRLPSELALGVRMVGLAHQSVSIKAPTGSNKVLVFSFEPGDLGKKAFVGTRLRREGDALILIYKNQAVQDLDGKTFQYRKN